MFNKLKALNNFLSFFCARCGLAKVYSAAATTIFPQRIKDFWPPVERLLLCCSFLQLRWTRRFCSQSLVIWRHLRPWMANVAGAAAAGVVLYLKQLDCNNLMPTKASLPRATFATEKQDIFIIFHHHVGLGLQCIYYQKCRPSNKKKFLKHFDKEVYGRLLHFLVQDCSVLH